MPDHFERHRIDPQTFAAVGRLRYRVAHVRPFLRMQSMRISCSAPIVNRSPGHTSVVEPYSSSTQAPRRSRPARARTGRRLRFRASRPHRRSTPAACAGRGAADPPRAATGRSPGRSSACEAGNVQGLKFRRRAPHPHARSGAGSRARTPRVSRRVIGRRDRHLDVVALAAIAHFRKASKRCSLASNSAVSAVAISAFHRRERRFEAGQRLPRERPANVDRVVEPRVGQQHAGGGERAGFGRHDDGRNRQFVRQRANRAAVRRRRSKQHEVARIASVFDRDAAQCARHHDCGDRQNTVGHPHDALSSRVAQRPGDLFSIAARAAATSSRKFAAEKMVGVDAAQHEVRIGDRRLRTAPAVTDRTRASSRRSAGRRAGASARRARRSTRRRSRLRRCRPPAT